ncbi:hypothetical protein PAPPERLAPAPP_05520 [Brevundimonas phage vB_BpoS-Papperlapapp]|nr:hypothetical protein PAPPERLAPAPP_05520 [Brevundimonas phage vB_BpoS-Papperlapapp]
MDDADWRSTYVIDLDLERFEEAVFTSEYHPTVSLGDMMARPSPWFGSSSGPSLEARLRVLIAAEQARRPTPPPPPDWRFYRASDVEWADHVRTQIHTRYGLSVPLAHLNDQPLEAIDHAETGSPKQSRWVGAIRDAISQMKARYPVAPVHKDLPPMPRIDYALLGAAVAFYEREGYRYVETPWAVSKDTIDITCPNPAFAARVDGLGYLVGSSEQSFLHLDKDGAIGHGRMVACTPCFRLGDAEDDLHFPTFMKVELYDNTYADDTGWKAMLADAYELALRLGAPKAALSQEKTDEGRDLLLAGIEIGSYGLRRHGDHIWSYGTGLTLPRFTQALDRARVEEGVKIPHRAWSQAGFNPLSPVPSGIVLMPPDV